MLADGTDADVFALAGDELEAAVQVFHVRDGRIRGQRGWVVEKVEDLDDADLVEHLLQQVYGDDDPAPATSSEGREPPERAAATSAVPREVLVPVLPPDVAQVEAWLTGCAGPVRVRVPQRGDKRDLAETVRRNAEQALVAAPHPAGRRPDHPEPGAAGDPGGAGPGPRRCGSSATTSRPPRGPTRSASMVVFEDGLPRKSEYRRFAVRGEDGAARGTTPRRCTR